MQRLILATAMLLLATVGCASQTQDNRDQAHDQIKQMMQDSADAWNNNDLDAFMLAFHNSPELIFAIPTGITTGWQPLKERYARSIANSDLKFTDIDITRLAPDAALVFARFHNHTNDGGYGNGLTTLLVRKINNQWVITHDHSSGLPADYPGHLAPQKP